MIAPRFAAVLAAALALACASAPTAASRAVCPAPALRAAPPSAPVVAGDAKRGKRSFRLNCAGCHAAVARRRDPGAPANAPRLDCPEWLAQTSDAYLYDAINRGPGDYGHGNRAPLGEDLRPDEIADLVAYLRSLAR